MHFHLDLSSGELNLSSLKSPLMLKHQVSKTPCLREMQPSLSHTVISYNARIFSSLVNWFNSAVLFCHMAPFSPWKILVILIHLRKVPTYSHTETNLGDSLYIKQSNRPFFKQMLFVIKMALNLFTTCDTYTHIHTYKAIHSIYTYTYIHLL